MFSLTSILALSFNLFNPSIMLNSGKRLSVIGNGPPVVFSAGLYGTMPRLLYNDFINTLKNNITIVSINDFKPITKTDIDDIANSLGVDSVSYISHSSFYPEVLESKKINKAILIDPICLPKIDIEGMNSLEIKPPKINVDYPLKIFKAEKLYNTKKPLPDWQTPTIEGNVDDEIIVNIGHPDILDDFWANIAKKIGFWETTEGEIVNHKDWKFTQKNNIEKSRKEYRNYISDKCLKFLNNN